MATTAFTSRRKFSRKGGDIAAALSRLAEARRQRDAGLALLRNDPLLLPLHGNPEFNALSKSLGFV